MSDESHGLWQASIGNDAQKPPTESTPGEGQEPVKAGATAAGLRNLFPTGKSVLLVDRNPETRDARAKMMRSMGVSVHGVATADAARSQLAGTGYNLVLVDLGRDKEGAELLVQEIRTKNPRQLVAFLVGSPLFIAKSLSSKNARPQPVLAPPTAVSPAPGVQSPGTPISAHKTNGPHVTASDFGQRIRDAEAAAKTA